MQNQIKQHTLWLLAAASAPLAHFSGCGWLPALVAAAAVLPLTLLPGCWNGMGRVAACIQLIWLGAVTGGLLKYSAVYWPSGNDLVVPLTLLALASLTGEAAAPRIGAVLAFCAALLAVPLAISGAAHVEPKWLVPISGTWPAALSLVLLFPCLPAAGEGSRGKRSVWLGVLGILAALLIQGTISPQVAASVRDPFYQTARTLGYLEPVVAVGVTLGWYAMAAFLLHSGSMVAENSGIGRKTAFVLRVGTALTVLLIKQQPDVWICTILSTVLWVLIPFLNKIIGTKKVEKRA